MKVTQLSGKIEKDRLHHAYIIEAPREEGVTSLRTLIEEFGMKTKGNPDFHEYIYDVFLLEHAHQLREEQSFHSAEGSKKIFLVAFNTILHEAQNALLKTLEEPTSGTHFFFVTRTSKIFFPTLLSRMQVISGEDESLRSDTGSGERFLGGTVAERMAMVEQWTKIKTEEKPKAKEEVRVFLESFERALYKKISEPKSDLEKSTLRSSAEAHSKPLSKGSDLRPDIGIASFAHSLEHILEAKQALSERSPSLKLLLEHLALTVPRISK